MYHLAMGARSGSGSRWRGGFAAAWVLLLSGCGVPQHPRAPLAIGVESQYADVLRQIGGPYIRVRALLNNPNTDPHAFEVSPSVAREVAGASLVVMNGLGYDAWIMRILAASPAAHRQVIDVRRLLGRSARTFNPHFWYDPRTMPALAAAAAHAFSVLDPAHAGYFQAQARRFSASLEAWDSALAAFRKDHGGTPVAVTEPVANALLEAAGCRILTPRALQLAVMNGTDPAPQDVAAQRTLLSTHQVRVLVYNQQVTDPLTASFLQLARAAHIPVVGVYETLPHGYHYQGWMQAELHALRAAVIAGVSTRTLGSSGAPR
jgi:zinc/manganese transport system substrate-binding protein